MSNIIEFPTRAEHSWKIVEKSIRSILKDTSAATEMQDEILEKMKKAHEKYNAKFKINFSIQMPASATEQEKKSISNDLKKSFTTLENQVQELMQEIFLDRLLLEIQLYNARNKTETTD